MLGPEEYRYLYNDIKDWDEYDWTKAGYKVTVGIVAGIIGDKGLSKFKTLTGISKISKIDDVAKRAMKFHYDPTNPGLDCSEIAENIYKDMGSGKIFKVKATKGRICVKDKGELEDFDYHQFYVKDNYVYDPAYSDSPVLFDDYMKEIRSNNKDIDIEDVTE